MNKKYYKVVTNKLESAYVGDFYVKDRVGSQLSVTYKIGEWVKPNIAGSQLMVFDDLDVAKTYLRRSGWGDRVYECLVKNPKENGIFINTDGNMLNNLLKVLKLKKAKKAFTQKLEEPILGTIFCDEVKLVSLV